jgi:hypothetical protein
MDSTELKVDVITPVSTVCIFCAPRRIEIIEFPCRNGEKILAVFARRMVLYRVTVDFEYLGSLDSIDQDPRPRTLLSSRYVHVFANVIRPRLWTSALHLGYENCFLECTPE